jgi:hypothetical protein
MTLQDQAELKIYSGNDNPLVGATFKTTFKHLENFYHYEIYVRVPDDHQQPDTGYEEINGQRMKKIASTGGFKTQGLAFQNMVQRIDELLQMARKDNA